MKITIKKGFVFTISEIVCSLSFPIHKLPLVIMVLFGFCYITFKFFCEAVAGDSCYEEIKETLDFLIR